jgi:GNAT superfamily N-acetyltransferase
MLEVRVLTESEVPALVTAFPEQGAAPASRHVERFARQGRGEITYLVAWEDARPIGYVFLRWPGYPGVTAQGRALGCVELADLFVADQARRRGVGSSLLDRAERLVSSHGHAQVGLEVTVGNPFNETARRLYHRRGYHESGLGTFVSGYTYWDSAGMPHRDEEPYVYLVKEL